MINIANRILRTRDGLTQLAIAAADDVRPLDVRLLTRYAGQLLKVAADVQILLQEPSMFNRAQLDQLTSVVDQSEANVTTTSTALTAANDAQTKAQNDYDAAVQANRDAVAALKNFVDGLDADGNAAGHDASAGTPAAPAPVTTPAAPAPVTTPAAPAPVTTPATPDTSATPAPVTVPAAAPQA